MAKRKNNNAHLREANKRRLVTERQNARAEAEQAQKVARALYDQKRLAEPRERLDVGRRRSVPSPALVPLPEHLAGMTDALDAVVLAVQLRNEAEQALAITVQRARWLRWSWQEIGSLTSLTADGARSKWGRTRS